MLPLSRVVMRMNESPSPNPKERLPVGETVLGKVLALKPYGAFVELPDGETGLLHISEVAEEYVQDIHEYLSVGQEIVVKVIGLSSEGKYNLSRRQVSPQEEEATRYFREAQEARRAIERRRENIQMEASWRKLAREKQKALSTSRQTLQRWLGRARQAAEELDRRSQERERFYGSLEL